MDIDKLDKLEKQAISFIKTVAKSAKQPLFAGNSGGKDSVIMEYLLQKSGISYTSEHSNTTIDPPGTLSFLRKHYPYTKIIQPELSFYKLVEKHGLPTRRKRFCCRYLKEVNGAGKITFLGIRAAESTARAGQDPVMCDTRSFMKGAQKVYPIYSWSDKEVWDFIAYKEIPLAPCYSRHIQRLGCVGCPLANVAQRKYEFEIYPRFYIQIKKAIEKGMQQHPHWLISILTQQDGELAMKWYLSGQSISQYFSQYIITGLRQGRQMIWSIKPNPNCFDILNEINPKCIIK
jgi:phosphoadenosine phosphosulfate reductase